MRILSLLIFYIILFLFNRQTDQPHGPGFKISCNTCHSSKGWKLDKEIYSFDHNTTKLPLTGQHSGTDCRLCHRTLIFSEAKAECNDCHNDVHQATTGGDCSRCHTSSSWLVNNINEIHQTSRFPLTGAHRTADCYKCHKSESLARFDVPGINCIDCHRETYMTTTAPDHIQAGYSEDCSSCHPLNAFQWAGAGFNHNFFSLAQGHAGAKCADCHLNGNYKSTSPDCYSCHKADFENTTNPDHQTLNFSVTCSQCHTLNPGWKPAPYKEHDSKSFPIYSGEHRGEWSSCTECHPNTSDYAAYSCIICHEHNQSSMDSKHRGRSNYSYDSAACFRCHPRGISD
jgi:hypothetical protein